MRNIIITTLATTLITFSFNANARLSPALEYKLMDNCIGATEYRKQKIDICGEALLKTIENGWSLDYNDEIYDKNQGKFHISFTQNIKTQK